MATLVEASFLVLSHLAALAIAGLWVWLIAAAGSALLDRWFRHGDDSTRPPPPLEAARPAQPLGPLGPLHRLLLDLAVGAGVVGTTLLAMGAVGALRWWAVLGAAGLAALLLRRSLAATGRRTTAAARGMAADVRAAGPLAWTWLPVAVMLAAAVVTAVAPVTDWDSLMYHLTVPAAWLEAGWIHVPPDNLHASRTGLLQILYVVPLSLGDHRAATLTALAFALALGATVYAVVRAHFGPREAVFAGATFWAAATVWFVAVTPRNDVALVFFLLLAHDALLRAMKREGRRPLALAGALLGLAVATKFQAVPYAIALLPLAWLDRRWAPGGSRPLKVMLSRMSVVAAAAVLVALPWLLKNVVLLDAPFYPLLAEPVPQPWIAALAGAGAVPALGEMMGQVVWQLTERFNLYDFLFSPGELSIEGEASLYRANFLLLALPLLLLVRGGRDMLLTFAAPALLYLAILLLGFPRANLRYLLPGIVPLAAVAAVATLRVADRFRRPNVVLAILGVAALLPATLAVGRATLRYDAHRHAAGLVSPGTYLARHWEYGPLQAALGQVAALDEDAMVLMLFEARGFHAPRHVLQDNKLTNWPYLEALPDGGSPGECLEGAGVTHILINRGALDFYLRSGALDLQLLRVPALEAFVERCTSTAWERAGMSLLQLERGDEPIRSTVTPEAS